MFLSPSNYEKIINNPKSFSRQQPILLPFSSQPNNISEKDLIVSGCEILMDLRHQIPNLLDIFLLKADVTDERLQSIRNKRQQVFYKIINTYVPQHPVHHTILGQHMKVKRCPKHIQKNLTKDPTHEVLLLFRFDFLKFLSFSFPFYKLISSRN